jgi:hypothetical protein
MFTDQQKAKCVLRYEFYEFSAAVRRKFRTFYHVHHHQSPQEKMQYCVGRKNSKKQVHWFYDQHNIEFSSGV